MTTSEGQQDQGSAPSTFVLLHDSNAPASQRYIDLSGEARSPAGTDILARLRERSDFLLVGAEQPFTELLLSGSPHRPERRVLVWEYWSDRGWLALQIDDRIGEEQGAEPARRSFRWVTPAGWATSAQGEGAAPTELRFWLRVRLSREAAPVWWRRSIAGVPALAALAAVVIGVLAVGAVVLQSGGSGGGAEEATPTTVAVVPTSAATPAPTASPTPTPTATLTPTPTLSPTRTPTATPTPAAATPASTPTPTATPSPTPAASPTPEVTPTSVPTPTPDVSGTWSVTVVNTVTTGACAGEEGSTGTEVIAIVQNGTLVTVTGGDTVGGSPSNPWSGTFIGTTLTYGGTRPEDGGTTTAEFTLAVDLDASTLVGTEAWNWSGPGGSCPGSSSDVTGFRVN